MLPLCTAQAKLPLSTSSLSHYQIKVSHPSSCEAVINGRLIVSLASSRTGSSTSDMARRLEYMEKILQRYTGQRELNLATLRNMADEEHNHDRGDISSDGSMDAEVGGVDSETYDLQPLDDNVARASNRGTISIYFLQLLMQPQITLENFRTGTSRCVSNIGSTA